MVFNFETKPIRKAKNESIIARAVYITGRPLNDMAGKVIKKKRDDVSWTEIMLPPDAPPGFSDLQTLTREMERAETRINARTGRQYIISLPNELPAKIQINMLKDFIQKNFISLGLCVIAAIHRGENSSDPEKNNPHAHILVSTRSIENNEFSHHKNRINDYTSNLKALRKQWEETLNHEYKRFNLEYRVQSTRRHDIDYEYQRLNPRSY